jgi:hypothetical protein
MGAAFVAADRQLHDGAPPARQPLAAVRGVPRSRLDARSAAGRPGVPVDLVRCCAAEPLVRTEAVVAGDERFDLADHVSASKRHHDPPEPLVDPPEPLLLRRLHEALDDRHRPDLADRAEPRSRAAPAARWPAFVAELRARDRRGDRRARRRARWRRGHVAPVVPLYAMLDGVSAAGDGDGRGGRRGRPQARSFAR